MGKRGPSPQGEYSGKSKVFSTRIRADLRSSLDAAAKVSGRSLSQEVEHRLRRTFVDEDRSENAFGSRRNYLLMRMAATALQSAQNPQNPKAEWLDDPVAFDQAMKFLNAVLKQVRPKGSAALCLMRRRLCQIASLQIIRQHQFGLAYNPRTQHFRCTEARVNST